MEIPEGFAQVNLFFSGFNVPTGAQVTFGVRLDDPVLSTPSSVAGKVSNALTTANLKAAMSNQVGINKILVKFGPNATGPSAEMGQVYIGTVAGEPVPPNTSVLVRKSTAAGGRAGSGRFFWPGIPEANVNGDGALTTAAASAWQTGMTAFLTDLNARDVPMVLLHADSSGPIDEPLEVVALSVAPKVATQRRRLRR